MRHPEVVVAIRPTSVVSQRLGFFKGMRSTSDPKQTSEIGSGPGLHVEVFAQGRGKGTGSSPGSYTPPMRTPSPFNQLLVAALLLASAFVSADTWGPPRTVVTLSANGQFRVTVVPRPIDGALPFFRDKVEGVEPAGQRSGETQASAVARVERVDTRGAWRLLWQRPLVNDVAPTSVLLTDDASFLVTFDNWHSAGYGDDVIAIYDRDGKLVRKLSLEQVLPPAYVHHIPRSVSSRWWGGKHALVNNDRMVELQIAPPGNSISGSAPHVPLRIRLDDGTVVPPSGAAWEQAMAKATALESKRLAAWEDLRILRATPLAAPSSFGTREWRQYMFELRDRIAGADERMGGMVLPAPGAEPGFHDGYDISDWFLGYDDEPYSSKSLILVSPRSETLAALLVRCFASRADGSMRKAHIVFVGTPEEGEKVASAAEKSGARLTLIDRTQPFRPGEPLPELPDPLWLPMPARF